MYFEKVYKVTVVYYVLRKNLKGNSTMYYENVFKVYCICYVLRKRL